MKMRWMNIIDNDEDDEDDEHHEHALKSRRHTLRKTSEAREHCVIVKGKSLML